MKLKTEAQVYAALVKLFAPPEYAVLPGVADTTGSGRSRTIDAIVMSLWPSRGLTIEAVEIKVTRNDLRRELGNPSKAEPIAKYVDHFWLAVGDAGIVQEDLPRTWGLLVPGKAGKLKITKQAPKLKPEPISRGFLAAILRRANEALEGDLVRKRIRGEILAEVNETMTALRSQAMTKIQARELKQLREKAQQVERFEQLAGIRFAAWREGEAERAAATVKTLLEAGAERLLARAHTECTYAESAGTRLAEDARAAKALLDAACEGER